MNIIKALVTKMLLCALCVHVHNYVITGLLIDILQEYTEEIDRLKKDLVATRDKNGIFLSPENYLWVVCVSV